MILATRHFFPSDTKWNMANSAFGADQAMGHEHILVRLAQNGRMSIPAKHRKRLGVEPGRLVGDIENRELRLRSIRDVLAELQATVRRYRADDDTESAVDWLIQERRREFAAGRT